MPKSLKCLQGHNPSKRHKLFSDHHKIKPDGIHKVVSMGINKPQKSLTTVNNSHEKAFVTMRPKRTYQPKTKNQTLNHTTSHGRAPSRRYHHELRSNRECRYWKANIEKSPFDRWPMDTNQGTITARLAKWQIPTPATKQHHHHHQGHTANPTHYRPLIE